MMKKLAAAVLVIFIILLTTQFVRHAYKLIFFSQESVLDRYNPKKSDINIDKTLSLKELSMIYADAEKRIRVYESGKSNRRLAQYESGEDPYEKKNMIKELITTRESNNRMMSGIIFCWVTGLIFIACGSLVYLKFEEWIGAAFIITGFTEMTSVLGPLFFMKGDVIETAMILTVKMICTFITLAGVIAFWYFTRSYHDR